MIMQAVFDVAHAAAITGGICLILLSAYWLAASFAAWAGFGRCRRR